MAPIIADYWERAEFPHEILSSFGRLNLGGATVKGYGCPGHSVVGAAMAAVETARVDGSISTFLLVHGSLCALTIGTWFKPEPNSSDLLANLHKQVRKEGNINTTSGSSSLFSEFTHPPV